MVDSAIEQQLHTELGRLPPARQREVLELTHFQGLTQTEIAEKMDKPLGTVKSLVRSALKVLRASAVGAGEASR